MGISIVHVVVVLIIKLLSEVCNVDSINLCNSAAEVGYETYTDKTIQNCGCKEGGLCIRKCCQNTFFLDHYVHPDGHIEGICIKHDIHNFTVPVYEGQSNIFDATANFSIGMLNCDNSGLQYIEMDQEFRIQKDGVLYYPFYDKIYDNDKYCVDERNGLTAYLCDTPLSSEDINETLVHVIAKLISVPFLMMTWLVYILLPERTVHRIAFMNHVFCLIPGNILLAFNQYTVVENDTVCFLLGYCMLFFMVAAFFWMNVICIDIWLTFCDLRNTYGQKRFKNRIITVASLYAWGLPTLNLLIVLLISIYGDKYAMYHPGIGDESCFLAGTWPTIFYYFGPIIILTVINLVLFILTAVNIQKMKKGANIESHMFQLYWKLLFVMGLNPAVNTHIVQWIAWLFSTYFSHDVAIYIWYFKDFSHACYGIIIFLTFACQKRIWISLKNRLLCVSKSEVDPQLSVTSNSIASENGLPSIHLKDINNTSSNVP